MNQTSISLLFNCGYARVAVYELSGVKRGKSRSLVNRKERSEKFLKLFSSQTSIDKQDKFWDDSPSSKFSRQCDYVLEMFSKKWQPHSARAEYFQTFSISKWESLPILKKRCHTLSRCYECAKEHLTMQTSFPGVPHFVPENSVKLTLPSTGSAAKEVTVTRKVMAELNVSYETNFHHSFTESVLKYCGKTEGLTRRLSATEKKKTKRDMQRSVCCAIEKKFTENAALNFLSENESFSGYQRKRLAQSFEQTEVPKKAKRCISDSFFENYKDVVMEKLTEWPSEKAMIWSELGRQCGLSVQNMGQKVKQVALESGIDVTAYLGSKSCNSRHSKSKLPGKEISIPSMPTIATLKQDIDQLLVSGKLTIGEPCSPYTVIRSSVHDGELLSMQAQVYGRKIPLLDLRKILLKRQEKYMRLKTDEEIDSLSIDEVKVTLESLGELAPVMSNHYALLKQLQRSRTLVLWHDHSTILGSGYLLMTIHTLYDPAVFLETDEYERITGKNCPKSIQDIVEEPELYILCMSSSSLSDQLATIGDRLDCLPSLEQPVYSSNNIPIYDSLKFFIGDHPAQSFERGTQVGGNYKCGGCGCRSDRFDDLAHVFNFSWRSLDDLQSLVLKGKYGNQPSFLKPFANLTKEQLKEELRIRGVFDLSGRKHELRSVLQTILCGAQRVPTILINNPSQPLSQVHLPFYTVLDSEPLHDFKGHLINLLTELPHILSGECKTLISELLIHLLFSKKQNGYSGSDLRVALIETNNLIQFQHISKNIKLLLSTAVKISERLYSSSDKRTPKSILQLYNCCWLHHELCKMLFPKPKEVSYGKFFGLYLHSLVVHAPRQYEIVCLRSVNTENQERIFQQAKQIAQRCTNRKPENIIPSVLIRIQSKGMTGVLSSIYQSANTRVEGVACKTPSFTGTEVAKSFIVARSHSWQAHLKRISCFLFPSKVWWNTTPEGFLFNDGDNDPEYRVEGPDLYHFRSCSIQGVEKRSEENWNHILQLEIEIPIIVLRLFDENGDLTSYRTNEDIYANDLQSKSNPSRSASSTHLDLSVRDVSNEDAFIPPPCHDCSIGSKSFSRIANESNPDFQVYDKTTSTPVATRNEGSVPHLRVQSSNLGRGLTSDDDISEVITSPAPDRELSTFGSINFSPIPDQLPPDFQVSGITTSTPNAGRNKENRSQLRLQSLSPCSIRQPMCSTPVCCRDPKQPKSLSSAMQASSCVAEAEVEGDYKIVTELDKKGTSSKDVNSQYLSKHAVLIAKLIGSSTDLEVFDRLHVQLKTGSQKPETSMQVHDQYKDVLAALQVKVLREKSIILKEIERYEKDYYSQHQEFPSKADNETYHDLCRKLSSAKALLRSWKISL